jgi:serine/threonine-protein kinase HipA
VTELGVWRGAELVGRLTQVRRQLRFEFDRALIERVGLGRPVVSLSLPTSAGPYTDRSAKPFFDGLLPEGEARRIIAYDFGMPESDTFGLLRMIGRDCAGALSLLPADEPPPAPERTTDLPELTGDAIDAMIANLRYHPLGVDDTVRASLGGVQEKLLLTVRSPGSWALPTTAVASTHILKPAIAGLTDTVANEAVCLRFAAHAGVRAASVSTARFGGREVLVVERFDRHRELTGHVTRAHQETACQALAVPVAATARKYEDAGGPSLRAIARLLTRWSTADQLDELLRQTTVNVLVGNADAHAMNVSFMIDDDGVTLSPLYDVFSTVAYPQLSVTPGMYVDGIRDIRSITRGNLVREAVSWGIGAARAQEVVAAVCDLADAALSRAIAETDGVPAPLADALTERVSVTATA